MIFVGPWEKEEFCKVMTNELEQKINHSSTYKTQRIVFCLGKNENIDSLARLASYVRCLIVRNAYTTQESEIRLMTSELLNCIKRLRFLRSLDFDGINFGRNTLPRGLKLLLLEYLSFKGCQLNALPAFICYFPSLETLDLRVIEGCRIKIPNILRKIKKLRHLYLPIDFQTHRGRKLRFDHLTKLETLENFDTKLCEVEDLFNLTKIWHLTVNFEGSPKQLERLVNFLRTLEDVAHLTVNIKSFHCYEERRHLIFRELLACSALRVLCMEGYLGKLPPCREMSKNLTEIVLSNSSFESDPMRTFETLPSLQVLILRANALDVKEITCSAMNFPELIHLELSFLEILESWKVEEGAMPKLSTLLIRKCINLSMLPDGLGLFENLKELTILEMPEEFNQRLSVVDGIRGADMDKVPPETSIIFE